MSGHTLPQSEEVAGATLVLSDAQLLEDLDMDNRDGMIRGLAATALLCCVVMLLPAQSFAQLAKGKPKFLGSAMSPVHPDFTTYWNQITPGNEGKWGSVEGSQNAYNWAPLDNIYSYTINHGYLYKHHCLVWGNQQPDWINALDSTHQRAEVDEWIRLVSEHCPGAYFVDVVNEPFHARPAYAKALGDSGTTGWDWVVTSFQIARAHFFPTVKLILNEYNVVHDNTATTNLLRLVDTLRVRHLIDAIGIQGHYFEFKSAEGLTPVYSYSVSSIKANLERLTSTGLPVYISEFDINEPNDSTQLANYQTYFPIFWDNPGVKGVTLWGYEQWDVWKVNAYLVRADGSERPALKWLRKYVASPLPPVLASPLGTSGEPRNPLLLWHPSTSALTYRLQISTSTQFNSPAVDTTLADTLCRVNLLAANTAYAWRVSALNDSGAGGFSPQGVFTTGTVIAGVEGEEELPATYNLTQNYPNPFNPRTVISYTIPVGTRHAVSLRVFDVLGHEVANLVDGMQDPGLHQVGFDASGLASGVYLYKLTVGNFVDIKKMVLVR